jgi:hypothetical protein
MPARNITDDVRSGRQERVELLESEHTALGEILSTLRQDRVVKLAGADPYATRRLIDGLATALIDNEVAVVQPTRPLIEAPGTLEDIATFSRELAELAEQQALVCIDLDRLLGGPAAADQVIDALREALAPLFLEPALWLILVTTKPAHHSLLDEFEYLLRRREDAINDRFGAAVLVREAGKPDRQLIFRITRTEARQAMDALRQPNTGFTQLLQVCLDGLVTAARDNAFEDPENHTLAGTSVLLVFEAALPFRPGYLHVLNIDVTGNRYRVNRDYRVSFS